MVYREHKDFQKVERCEALSISLYKDIVMREEIQHLIARLEKHHSESALHSMRVGKRCHQIGVYNNYSEQDCATLALAGLFHDLGKLGIPLCVLDKESEPTPEEYKIINQHPRLAFLELKEAKYEDVRRVLVLHHECKEDVRKNYPRSGGERRDAVRFTPERRIHDEKIDRFGQLLAAVDICDALANKRSYKDALTLAQTEEVLRREFAGDQRFVDQAILFESFYRML